MEVEIAEKIARLPLWAQSLIGKLRRDIERLRADIASLSGASGVDSPISYRASSGEGNLPGDSQVEFKLADKESIEISLRREGDRRFLYVYADSGALIIRPHISNVVEIRVDPLF